MLKKYDFRRYNVWLTFLVTVIAVFGAYMIRSASDEGDFKRQIVGIAVGVAGMIFVSLIDYNFIMKTYCIVFFYLVNGGLLLWVELNGKTVKGATRWIEVVKDRLTIQPSEFSKIFLILILAKLLSSNRERINHFRFLFIVAAVIGLPVLLIAKQPDLSTTILICLVLATMIYCAGLSYKNILIIVLTMIPIAAAMIIYIQTPNQKLLEPYQVNRIMAFINQEDYEYEDDRYQQIYSVQAIGSGQLYGKGYDNDDASSIKNAGYIAEAQNDFIFAVIGEELGFIGSCFLIVLLFLVSFECIRISIWAKDFAGRLICCGMAAFIAYQTFINIGVATELLPNTGIPLPFISKGLSSLIAIFGGMGIVLNISLQRNKD